MDDEEGQALGVLPAPEAQRPWGTWCESTLEHRGLTSGASAPA